MSLDISTPPRATGYLLLFRHADIAQNGITQNEAHQILGKVAAWFDGLSSAGQLVGAQPLMEEGVVITGKSTRSITDGPFVETKEAVGGYVLLSVNSLEEAVEIAKSNPMHEFGITTEVRPTASCCPHLYRLLNQDATTAA